MLSDEDLLGFIRDMEETARKANNAAKRLKGELLERMMADGARIRLTNLAKVRLYEQSILVDKQSIHVLYDDCPVDLRSKCFAIEYKPLKRGLSLLAKLSSAWNERICMMYKRELGLRIEWCADGAVSSTSDSEMSSDGTPYSTD